MISRDEIMTTLSDIRFYYANLVATCGYGFARQKNNARFRT